MPDQRILLVDDEDRFRRNLARALRGHDYDVRECATGNEAITAFKAFRPQVVLLDLMLPDVDGLTVCRELRTDSEVALIVLSVVGDERTKIRALDEGADDYLSKPFGADELLARIRAVLRRAGSRGEDPAAFESDALTIDYANHTVLLDGEEVRLTPIEYDLLKLFSLNPGKLLRHETILNEVWHGDGDAPVLRTYIKRLRAKLGDSSTTPHVIRTDPGLGYRFILPGS